MVPLYRWRNQGPENSKVQAKGQGGPDPEDSSGRACLPEEDFEGAVWPGVHWGWQRLKSHLG